MMRRCVHLWATILLSWTGVLAATGSTQCLRVGTGAEPNVQVFLSLSSPPASAHNSRYASIARVGATADSSELTIITPPADTMVQRTQTATLQVILQSTLAPTVEWFKVASPQDIRMDPADPNVDTEVVLQQRATYTATLSIRNADFKDAGQYYCRIHGASGAILDSPVARLFVQGLVAHWTLDKANYVGGLHSDSVGGHSAEPAGVFAFVAGADGQAQGAVGIDSHGGWASVEPFDPLAGTGQMTLSLWAKSSDVSKTPQDLWIADDPNHPAVAAPGRFKTDGGWQHICVVLDGTTASIYTNGILRGQGAWSLPKTFPAALNIGSIGNGEAFFNGALDDVRVYNSALSPTDIAVLYENWMAVLEVDDPGAQGVHDPCIIRQGSYVYVFCTGRGIPIRRSSDLYHWVNMGRIFATTPAWVTAAVPGVSDLWAPDVSYRNGRYYICYAASTFGSNTSSIGLVSNVTLDPSDPNYRWVDEGKVISSNSASNYNAIDGNVIHDQDGQWWLAFGSFWTGIKLTHLDPNTGKPDTQPPVLFSLADRPNHAIEAAFIVFRDGYYYLFPSYDFCCQGANSTYNIRVGRSTNVSGSYRDEAGVAMLQGGGTQLFQADPRWKGPGHCAVFNDKGQDYIVYHAYDALNNGRSALRIRPIYWSTDLWPQVGAAITEPVE